LKIFLDAGFALDHDSIMGSKSIRQFDQRFTIVIGGWKNLQDYYRDCSSENYLGSITIPMLFINSADDPMFEESVIPIETITKNPNLILAVTPKGGHVGWCKLWKPSGKSHVDEIFPVYLKEVFTMLTDKKNKEM
jgi:abhydrolase domain-containing protein 1/3